MLTMYLCFLTGGAVLPILSTILGVLGDGADSDFDSGDFGNADLEIDTDVDFEMDLDTDVDVNTELDLDAGSLFQRGMESGRGLDSDAQGEIPSVFSLALYPTSLMALSTLAVIFGATGGVMTYYDKNPFITFGIALIAGYLSSIVIQSIVKTLRRIQTRSYGLDERELMLYDGKVVDTILPGQLGSVSFVTLKNIRVSYPARCMDQEMRLETGRVVEVKEIKDGIFYVEPKNKYETKEDMQSHNYK